MFWLNLLKSKIIVMTVKGLKLATSCTRDKDANKTHGRDPIFKSSCSILQKKIMNSNQRFCTTKVKIVKKPATIGSYVVN